MSPTYAFDSKPASGQTMPVADGLHWLRMPLPFDLDHINLWLFEDDGGWAIVDTGISSATSKEIWSKVFDDTMRGLPVTHVIATHLHPDHMGCAGWLTRRFDVDLWMTREECMLGRLLVADTGKPAPEAAIRFYAAAGFSDEALQEYRERFGFFGRLVSRLPESYVHIQENDQLALAEPRRVVDTFRVLFGRRVPAGHRTMATGEAIAHLNYLLATGDAIMEADASGVHWYRNA